MARQGATNSSLVHGERSRRLLRENIPLLLGKEEVQTPAQPRLRRCRQQGHRNQTLLQSHVSPLPLRRIRHAHGQRHHDDAERTGRLGEPFGGVDIGAHSPGIVGGRDRRGRQRRPGPPRSSRRHSQEHRRARMGLHKIPESEGEGDQARRSGGVRAVPSDGSEGRQGGGAHVRRFSRGNDEFDVVPPFGGAHRRKSAYHRHADHRCHRRFGNEGLRIRRGAAAVRDRQRPILVRVSGRSIRRLRGTHRQFAVREGGIGGTQENEVRRRGPGHARTV
mmetsp:Transcript_19110/g.41651  ORF Transcript_19110/g.41651 Transcript_19110/m.41651 type:complete len:277 (-) Transcript_19110:4183-5013(-)